MAKSRGHPGCNFVLSKPSDVQTTLAMVSMFVGQKVLMQPRRHPCTGLGSLSMAGVPWKNNPPGGWGYAE